MPERKLRVFLCHASQDKPIVHELYQRLLVEEWIDTWIDAKNLLPGQDWRIAIQEAVETADNVIICLSNNSVSKEGYIQKEMRYAQEISLEKPEGTIFLIPLRLDECETPRGLRFFQWTNYFGEEKERSYEDLLKSLRARLNEKIRKDTEEKLRLEAIELSRIAEEKARMDAEEKARHEAEAQARALKQKERRKAESLRRKQEKEKALREEKAKKEAEEQARKEAEDRIRRQEERRAYQKERRLTRAKKILDIEKRFGFRLSAPVIVSFPGEAFKLFNKNSSKDFLWWSILVFVNLSILLSDLKGYSFSIQVSQWWAGIILTLWVIISGAIGLLVSFIIYITYILKTNNSDISVKYGDVVGDNLFLLFKNGMLGAMNLNTMKAVVYDSGHAGSNKFFVLPNDHKIFLEEGFIIDCKKGKRVGRLRKLHSYDKVLSVNQNKNIWAVNNLGNIEIRNFGVNKIVYSFRSYFTKMAAFTNKGDDIVVVYQEKKDKEKEEHVSRFEYVNIPTQNKTSHVIHQFHSAGLSFAIDAEDSLIVFANGTSIMIYSISKGKDIGFIDLGQQIYSLMFLHESNLLVISLPQELMILNINNQDQFSISYKPKSITNLLYLPERKEILGFDKPKASFYRWKIEDVSNNEIES